MAIQAGLANLRKPISGKCSERNVLVMVDGIIGIVVIGIGNTGTWKHEPGNVARFK